MVKRGLQGTQDNESYKGGGNQKVDAPPRFSTCIISSLG